MHFVLIALIGITTTQPPLVDQAGDNSWTAPDYRIVEEISINPLDYGEPIGWSGDQAKIACQMFFVPTDEGEKWRVVMIFKNKVVVLQEDAEVRDIALTCSPAGAVFSRSGRYVLVQGYLNNQDYDELINIDTGEIKPYLFRQDTGWSGYVFVCDNGSTARSSYGDMYRTDPGQIQIIDSNLNVLVDWIDQTSGTWQDTQYPAHRHNGGGIGIAANGSLFLRSFKVGGEDEIQVTAYDGNGEILWESSDCPALTITSDGMYIILSYPSGISTMDARTGELLQHYDLEEYLNAPTCSSTGHAWAVQLRGTRGHYAEDQRYDARRGLAWGTDPNEADNMNVLSYVSNNWDHINPYRVAESGSVLGIATALPRSGHNHAIWKFVYVNSHGEIVWTSQIVNLNVEQSPYMIAASNFNHEHELGSIPSVIQSDGDRFGFYNGSVLVFFRLEGSDQL